MHTIRTSLFQIIAEITGYLTYRGKIHEERKRNFEGPKLEGCKALFLGEQFPKILRSNIPSTRRKLLLQLHDTLLKTQIFSRTVVRTSVLQGKKYT
jgi:hypothetical protein